jgi:hypothetical protein
MKHGKCMYFTNAGEPLREENWRAIDPSNPYDTVDIKDVNDPSKIVRREVIKLEPNSYKNGTWTYYDPMSGTVAKTETWQMDKLKTPEELKPAEGDDMTPVDASDGKTTTAKKEDKKPTKPKEVMDFEKKNSGKKKVKYRDGATGG